MADDSDEKEVLAALDKEASEYLKVYPPPDPSPRAVR